MKFVHLALTRTKNSDILEIEKDTCPIRVVSLEADQQDLYRDLELGYHSCYPAESHLQFGSSNQTTHGRVGVKVVPRCEKLA